MFAQNVVRRLDELSPTQSAGLVFLVLVAIYAPTATWSLPASVDVVSAATPAWRLAEQSTLDVTGYGAHILEPLNEYSQLVERDGDLLSGRNPGVIAVALPFYWLESLSPSSAELPMWPSALVGILTAAGTGALLVLVFRRLTTGPAAIGAALFFGLATATWTVSADSLWPHGPTQLLLTSSMLAIANQRHWTAGLGFGAALVVRPYSGIAAAASGLHAAWAERRLAPAVRIGVTTALGLAAFLLYTRVVFGIWSPFGGYAPRGYLQENLQGSGGVVTFLEDVYYALVHHRQGLLIYAPFLMVLVLGLRAGWHAAPTWVRSAFLGGAAFYLLQLYVGSWNGGTYFWTYRYPLEFLTMSSPMWLLAWREGIRPHPLRNGLFLAAGGIAFGLQVIGAVLEPYV